MISASGCRSSEGVSHPPLSQPVCETRHACAWGVYGELAAINDSLKHPDDPKLQQKVGVATASAIVGCAVPLVASLL